MPGKTWERTKKGARDLNRHISKGTTVYTVANMATNLAPYEDAQTYSAHTFDRQSRITGLWMTGHLSVEGLLAQYGTVHEQPPRGMRNIAGPAPQVAGPLPEHQNGPFGAYSHRHLDDAEIRGLEKHVADMPDPKKRGRLGGWRV